MKKLVSVILSIIMVISYSGAAFADARIDTNAFINKSINNTDYNQAINNLEKSKIFSASEKAIIREFIDKRQKEIMLRNSGGVGMNSVIVPGLPDYNVKYFTKIVSYSKKLTSKDVWAKNGYFFMQGTVISITTGGISTSVQVCQSALTAAGILLPFIVAGQLAPEIQVGSTCYVDKYFKWNNSYNYEYTVRYNYKTNFTDSYGRTATLVEGSDYYYGDIGEE